MIKHFSRNAIGRDFAVGDIHGCFRLLALELEAVGFDESRDRLFSVGDLIDRGPDSDSSIDWLARPWFHAVRGNHEEMAIGVVTGTHNRDVYVDNGGAWFLRLPPQRRRLFASAFNDLPLAIDIETTHGRVGVVHADLAARSWAVFAEELASFDTLPFHRQRLLSEGALWSRRRISLGDTDGVPDLHAMIVGHTPGTAVRQLGNVFYIDTGAVFKNGKLTVIDLETLN